MAGEFVITVNDDNFQQEVLESAVLVVVDFWAEWCGPCKMLAPTIDEVAKELEGKVKVCKLDVEDGTKVATDYSIMNIPTVLMFKKGEVVDKIVGLASKNDIIARINNHSD